MQFVANGPVIPEALLQAHEEGRVVFFCGAGISYPAGLPNFRGLVDRVYELVGTKPNLIEQEAYNNYQYDATLNLLEHRLPGQRYELRKALMQALQPKLKRKGASDTHKALLELSKSHHDGALRLVTTNFDRIFQRVAKLNKQSLVAYPAPMLPIPKKSRWNGIVYLHGLLPEHNDESELNKLVLTSGDFGLAYLTERWASRFVSELFRNYVVCFVGYSINDPVLRYMMDALAADRILGEDTPQAYALGDCEPGQEKAKTIEWEAKGVSPILYERPIGKQDHSALHLTLKTWAKTYSVGILGKERIVVDNAMARPSASTKQDDFVSRMLWALSDESGIPAKQFADFNPVPPLDWLDAFSEGRYLHDDLKRFGIHPLERVDEKLRFSLIRRPTSYSLAPWMSLVSDGASDSRWDNVMFQLARWLARHLNDPALVIWIAQRGGKLHNQFDWLIEDKLSKFFLLESEGKMDELKEIQDNAPNAIPSTIMRVVWRLLLTGRVKSSLRNFDFYRWKDRLKRSGITATLRLELRELLSPKIELKKPFRWDEGNEKVEGPEHLKELIDWNLELSVEHAQSSIKDIADMEHWKTALPFLLDDFQQLLTDALDLLSELGAEDDKSDYSYWDLPSISPHRQNRGFKDWVVLIELVRDAWLALREVDALRASGKAMEWFRSPYPCFKRLALFAASQDNCISSEQWVDWLLTDNSWCLWSIDMQRETMRLLVLQGSNLSTDIREKLEAAILSGPPRAMYRDDIEPEQWRELVDSSVWLHLAKLQISGGSLGKIAMQRLNVLSIANPSWKLAEDERDEFAHWMSSTGDPDYEDRREIDKAPRKRKELVDWLKRSKTDRHPFYEDTWSESCRARFFHCFYALCDLAQEEIWQADRWRDALQVWSEDGRVQRSWQFTAPLLESMPDNVMQEIAHSFTWWLKAVSKLIERHEAIFIALCQRVLAQPHQDVIDTDQPVARAINHPIGHISEALLNYWLKKRPDDNDTLPEDVKQLFTKICDTNEEKLRHGRVLLASRLIALFRVDCVWTEKHLLPLFDWATNKVEAKAVWEGFLWSPRLYPPLMTAFKKQFLETARYYEKLGEHKRQYAAFLTYAALGMVENYTNKDFQTALATLPQEGLNESARALHQALEGAGDQAEEYWKNRIKPFWKNVWPKSRDLASNSIAESLARMCVAAGNEFPSAVTLVYDWLRPIEHPDYIVHRLNESGLSGLFPDTALVFLTALISNQPWGARELGQCLEAISLASNTLTQDHRFQRLIEYSRKHAN
jgi:hypothetical protein